MEVNILKFLVNLTEIHYGFIEVEADDEESAMEIAIEESNNGNVHYVSLELKVDKPIPF